MERQGIISRIFSPWASALVVVPKPGPGDDLRLCIDLRDVNEKCETVNYPLPDIDDIVSSLGGSKYYCKLDLAKGFWQIPVEQTSKKVLTIITHRGTFCFNRMPFGHKNSPAYF